MPQIKCGKCLGGRVMVVGDEPTCINCGWRPESVNTTVTLLDRLIAA